MAAHPEGERRLFGKEPDAILAAMQTNNRAWKQPEYRAAIAAEVESRKAMADAIQAARNIGEAV